MGTKRSNQSPSWQFWGQRFVKRVTAQKRSAMLRARGFTTRMRVEVEGDPYYADRNGNPLWSVEVLR